VSRTLLLAIAFAACGHRSGVSERERAGSYVRVVAHLPGAHAETTEHALAIPLEYAAMSTPHVTHVSTRIEDDEAILEVELDDGADVETAFRDLRSALLQGPSLPATATPPLMTARHRGALLRYVIRGGTAAQRVQWDLDVEAALMAFGNVERCGADGDAVMVELDPVRLSAAQKSISDVVSALELAGRSANVDVTSIAATPIASSYGLLHVRDVALVRVLVARERASACSASDETGEDVLVGTVFPSTASTLELREAAEQALAKLRAPPGLSLVVLPRTRPVALAIDATDANPNALTTAIGQLAGVVAVVGERSHGRVQLHVVPHDDDARGELLPLLRASDRRAYLTSDPVIQVQALGERASQLASIVHGLAQAPGIDAAGEVGTRVEVAAQIDRDRCAELGVAAHDVATSLAALTDEGYRLGFSNVAVRVAGGERSLDLLYLNGRVLQSASLASLVTFEPTSASADIRREDGRRWAGVRVRGDLDAAQAAVRALRLPPGYEVRIATDEP
jgi:multidrug efflux pump subunit AcrB